MVILTARWRWFLSIVVVQCVTNVGSSEATSFGTGPDRFEIEFVTIGNPGNLPDTRPSVSMGAVDYEYQIAKYEISCLMTRTALRAGAFDGNVQSNCTTYGEDHPAHQEWINAAKFVNWLNTSSGYPPAYKLNDLDLGVSLVLEFWEPSEPAYNPDNITRNSLAKFAISNTDEWHKAAYYDATTESYNLWATGNAEPAMLGPEGGVDPNTAVYGPEAARGLPNLAVVTRAGGLSAYGTMGQTGNQTEWEEGPFVIDFLPGTRAKRRGAENTVRASQLTLRAKDVSGVGGFRVVALEQPAPRPGDTNADGIVNSADFFALSSNFGREGTWADGDFTGDGFVRFDDFLILSTNFKPDPPAAVPEPSTLTLLALALCSLGAFRRRR